MNYSESTRYYLTTILKVIPFENFSFDTQKDTSKLLDSNFTLRLYFRNK
jgi:hypothetical protein